MRITHLLLAGALCTTSVQAATLIEFNFDERGGTADASSYADSSGNNRNASFNRFVSQPSDFPFSETHPELAGLDFSGRTLYNAVTQGTVSGASSINLRLNNNSFTMEGWVNIQGIASIDGTPASVANLWNLVSTAGGTTSVFGLRYNSSRLLQITFNSQSQSGGTRIFSTDVTLELNTWTHLAYVKNGSNLRVYVNGVQVGVFSESGITSRALPNTLSSVTIANNLYGSFDDFRLSDVALAPSELGFHSPFTAIPEPSTMTLALTAMGGLVLGLRRRRC